MESSHLLWTPSEKMKKDANLRHYIDWLRERKQLTFSDYQALWNWSVTDINSFWKSIWEYFDILHDGEISQIYSGEMPAVKWFEGTKLNYAEHIFRKANDTHPAILFKSESTALREVSWKELSMSVSALQALFKAEGIQQGDTIAAYLPCIPEASMALLATTSIGAVWSSCSPDFGTNAVIDRFNQIEPKVLFAVDQYTYNGKSFDKTSVVQDLINALPSLKCIILVSDQSKLVSTKQVILWKDIQRNDNAAPEFTRVSFNHPIWILYSSGTTGLPKAITHSHGGILLEQLKYGSFHNDFKPGERCFWYTTTGWMMWNYIHGSLLTGGTMVLYDGSPGYPDLSVLWEYAEQSEIHHFGTSAAFILANLKEGITPSKKLQLANLRSIGSTGSTLPPEGFEWIYQHVKQDIWLASMSGGTDVCSAFVGGNPLWPVYAGEIQCRALGCKLEAFDDDGKSITNSVGEMVISKPMPSMPVFFWNDPTFERYKESYFEMFPGVWRHGDWIEITSRQGVIIYGRSDATLNRGGVRIGTSEIYRAVDKVEEVKDSLIICIEKEKGEFWMPLFVVMKADHTLTDDIKKKINTVIKNEYSPRHVPDEVVAVEDIPYTISGKKTETPVKKILMGKDPKTVVNFGSLRNPKSIDHFITLFKHKRP
ncbi:acetoacetate--CoA ligase [Chryseosolibacter indicus]|uniref:Acetoacetate--CoA ligase n=1 Tax=Chryseosolibacter indicus TaxID=2782351 RepID=A0ABS5VTF5_9BACT|nr:acetoacetate--CoA ligase [Chryseosolibacter indicus]MBT1704687.1 acetoacetate--CoA ligase [Chryseosolibacter indicus]